MHSIKTKITAVTLCVIVIAMAAAAGLGGAAIRNIGTRSAEQTLLLLCETGEKTWTTILRAWHSPWRWSPPIPSLT